MNAADNTSNEIVVAAAVIVFTDGTFLLARKSPGLSNAGLWEFPGGKVEPDETPSEALKRELKEELNLEPNREMVHLLNYRWNEKSRVIHFHFFRVMTENDISKSKDHDAFTWVTPGDPVPLEMVDADKKALQYILDHPACLVPDR